MSAVLTATATAAATSPAPVVDGPAATPTQLRLSGITKAYSAKDGPVLSGIDLDVARGELVSLLGPSGCGKSTLLRLVAGFIRPEEGCIEIGSRDVTHTATHKRGVGIVHQSHALWPHLTVAENVAFGLEMRKVKRDERARRVMEMLDLVGLGGFERRLPTELSGGQQQRVALARALVVRPEVLLLDEPLSSLDANLRVHLREEIRRIQRDLQVTTVFVTHDREEAMAVSDRIVILDGGHIAQQGTATELYREPRSQFVMGFTGATVGVAGTVGEGGRVDSPYGTIVPAVTGLTPGSAVQVCVRPEDLGVASDDRTGEPGLTGTLVEVAFLGSSAEARVDLDVGDGAVRRVEVRLHPRQIVGLPEPGSTVHLVVDPDHLHVFSA
ncbi:MAG: ABC transporter ATP-binding protein [Ilumatobacteraceae bacterium]